MAPRGLLQQLVSLVQSSIDDISRISTELRPSTIDDLGILPTISWFCREYASIFPNIAVGKVIVIEEHDVRPSIRIHIFRIIQEALNNVARHSNATAVQISLTKHDDGIELSISDNGIGFNAASPPSPHEKRRGFGLISMKERANYFRRKMQHPHRRRQRREITVTWPLNRKTIR